MLVYIFEVKKVLNCVKSCYVKPFKVLHGGVDERRLRPFSFSDN